MEQNSLKTEIQRQCRKSPTTKTAVNTVHLTDIQLIDKSLFY